MKKVTLLLGSILILGAMSIAVFSCKKEQETSKKPIVKGQSRISNCDPGNDYNPLDSVGFWHNEAYNYFADSADSRSTTWNFAGIFAANHGFADIPSEANTTLTFIEDDISYDFVNYNANLSCSDLAKSYNAFLIGIFCDTANSWEDECEFFDAIKTLEGTILADNDLTVSERNTLLGACSIARFTTYNHIETDPSYALSIFEHWLEKEKNRQFLISDAEAYIKDCNITFAAAVSFIVWSQYP